jgi:hypothetical protein
VGERVGVEESGVFTSYKITLAVIEPDRVVQCDKTLIVTIESGDIGKGIG